MAGDNVAQESRKPMSSVSIRYMIDDVAAAIEFYTTHLSFVLETDASETH